MPRVIAYDFARLFIGPIFHTPRGIDRVDLAVAQQLFKDDASPNLGILPTPWGVRAFPSKVIRRWLANLNMLWADDIEIERDPQLLGLIRKVGRGTERAQSSPLDKLCCPSALSLPRKASRVLGQLQFTDIRLGRCARTTVPEGSAYLNIGQIGLAVPIFHNWLARRRDITCAMMLHDAIPLEHPHLVPAGADAHHARMIRTAARHADCLIFNSVASRDSVNHAMDRLERVQLPGMVRALPLPKAFFKVRTSLPALADIHYFVVVSTIEQRKNQELLIRVWSRLIDKMGEQAPHLIIVGSLGHDAERILAPLDARPILRRRIHVVSGLSSPALASLVLGAAGMLCPTWTEGFGLPLLEANAMGVPAIVSDIPAHREFGYKNTTYLPCDDDILWEKAILATRPVGLRERPPLSPSLTQAAYCDDIMAYLDRTTPSLRFQRMHLSPAEAETNEYGTLEKLGKFFKLKWRIQS